MPDTARLPGASVNPGHPGLQAVALGLLEDHAGACVTEAVRKGGDEGAESAREAAEAITRQ